MNRLSSSSEKGLSKSVYLPSAITELMTSAISLASLVVAGRIVAFIGECASFLAPRDLRRSCARFCHAAGGELEQIQFCWGTFPCKQQSATWSVNKDFVKP